MSTSASRLGSSVSSSATVPRRSAVLPPYTVPSTAMSTFGVICAKRSRTVGTPMSVAHMLQMAPSEAQARKATMVSGRLGR